LLLQLLGDGAMGNKSSGQRLAASTKRAGDRAGKVAVSARYKRLPKKLEDDYDILTDVLGNGYNGSVFRAKSKTQPNSYAVKGFHLQGVDEEKMKQLEAEAEIFLSMDHPHVARLVDVYESDEHLYLVMECMEGGELFERLTKRKRFSEKDASHAVWQMLLAVNYIHAKGIVHRDLKLENFLYESQETDHLKLIDFGFSHIWEPNTKMALSCGTLAYVAPEVLKKSYTSKCDLWSMGVILFILLAGYMPFSGAEKLQRKAIESGNYSWREDRWKHVSKIAQDLVKKLMTVDPERRLSAEQALSHEFILAHDKQDIEIDHGVADALRNFSQASNFRRACMNVMAWSLSNEERAKVRDMFIKMDTSNKGTITMCELKQVLTEKFTITDDQIKPIFEALDTSQNDEIHYTEFLAAMVSTRLAMHDDLLAQTFARFDVDNTGFITLGNLRTVLGESFSGADVEKLIAEADATKDGKISYQEFIQFLKSDDDNDGHLNEVADKILDTQLAKPQTATFGSLAWAKDTTCGLLARTGMSSILAGGASQVDRAASKNSDGGDKMQERGSNGNDGLSSTVANAPTASTTSKQQHQPRTSAESACCAIL
jgi:calcium-dependent protein kinase